MKFDIRKAFDTINWEFILQSLVQYGFCKNFVDWIRTILHSARLSIVVNGKAMRYFGCTRGVRQGDPLSPIFFCLAEDVLSCAISNAFSQGLDHHIASPRGTIAPSHVLYADDIMVFGRGTKRDVQAIMIILEEYGHNSGQYISAAKCTIFSSKHITARASIIAASYDILMGTLPFRYLGVPIFQGKPKKSHLNRVMDRIKLKFAAWKGKSLSMMGRVELVKTVIASSALYSFHVYKWPSSCIKILEQWIRNFVWTGDINSTHHNVVAWDTVCLPEFEGGLGIKSMKSLNNAALMKMTWKVMTGDSEFDNFIRTCFKGSSYKKSSVWHSFKEQWHIIQENIIWLVADGSNIDFWNDVWCINMGSSIADFLDLDNSNLHNTVADFIEEGKWCFPTYIPELEGHVQQRIRETPYASHKAD